MLTVAGDSNVAPPYDGNKSTCPPCPPGQSCCDYGWNSLTGSFSYCIPHERDPQNCGGCGRVCDKSEVCCDSKCVLQTNDACGCPARMCNAGETCCARDYRAECIDLTRSVENCGRCGHSCPHLAKCVNGRCCYSEADFAEIAALICIASLGADCDINATYQQLQSSVCP
jgi:hypothetical protein